MPRSPAESTLATALDTPALRQLLRERFGLAGFRAGQGEVLAALDAHRAALAVFPTGGGKCLCYQLPALRFDGAHAGGVAADRADEGPDRLPRARAASRPRGWTRRWRRREARQVERAAERGELKLLYVAPERFNNERFLAWLERAARSRCSPSTRRTASPSGATTSAPTT